MIAVGFFKERHGKDYPMFKTTKSDIPRKNRVLEYLRKGKIIAVAPGRIRDIFTDEAVPGEILAYSDGKYYWNSETIYYFEKYNMKLPDEFINRILD